MGDNMVRRLLWLIVLAILSSSAFAVPPVATEFYGTITSQGSPVTSGTILANTSGNVTCGTFLILNSGKYGLLSCKGDDTDTGSIEGALGSEVIHFSLGSTALRSFGLASWEFGGFREVNLTTFAVCGDTYCDAQQNETCSRCTVDCGVCDLGNQTNTTGNFSGNGTNATGNGTISGGGGGSLGGSAGAGGPGGAGSSGGSGASSGSPVVCKERWECSVWRPRICPPSEVQTRLCRDLNNCVTSKDKPPTQQACRYQGSCRDGVRNNNETDIDCGGDLCEPCGMGMICAISRDCISGFCDPGTLLCALPPPEPVIARTKPVELTIPGLVETCGNIIPWRLIIALLLLAVLPKIFVEYYLRRYAPKFHKRYRAMSQEDKFMFQIRHRRRAHWLTIALLFVTLFVSFYAYLFLGCPGFVGIGLVVIIVLSLLTFYTLYMLMRYFEYHEQRTHRDLQRLMTAHLEHLAKLVNIEEKALSQIERELLDLWQQFQKAPDPSTALKLEPFTIALAQTLDLRTKKKDVDEAEKKLIELGKPLLDDNLLKNLEERNPTIKRLMDRLRLLNSHYKRKHEEQ